jgi:polyphosphate kinase 2 (PPK2 family)
MKINSKDFRVEPGKKVKLKDRPAIVKPFCKSKKEYRELLEEHVAKLSSLQRLLYASDRYALLLIFQGMDAAGKDGAIRHVMSGVNPQGCEVSSFKQPSAEELEHDFLWRTTRRLPERGKIGIFNRSHYEEVLVVRVHPEILRSQGLSAELRKSAFAPSWTWKGISIATGPAPSKYSCTFRKKSSASDSWSASTTPIRTGSSASRIFTKENTGSFIWTLMRIA